MRQQYPFLVAAVLCSISGCVPASDAQLEANKEVVRRFAEAQNNGDIESLNEVLAPDVVRHCQATPDVEIRSREDFVRFFEASSAVFSNARVTIDIMVAEGDMVATYGSFTGTQDGRLGLFPPTGKGVDSKFLSIARLEAGKIAELWVEWDNLGILTQLGHFPPIEDGG
ncbi:MAG: ester cyclase [Gemmatimonadota bacterium]|nr:MAG: ester cyclase [Gemmatimonadota bacterium]